MHELVNLLLEMVSMVSRFRKVSEIKPFFRDRWVSYDQTINRSLGSLI